MLLLIWLSRDPRRKTSLALISIGSMRSQTICLACLLCSSYIQCQPLAGAKLVASPSDLAQLLETLRDMTKLLTSDRYPAHGYSKQDGFGTAVSMRFVSIKYLKPLHKRHWLVLKPRVFVSGSRVVRKKHCRGWCQVVDRFDKPGLTKKTIGTGNVPTFLFFSTVAITAKLNPYIPYRYLSNSQHHGRDEK